MDDFNDLLAALRDFTDADLPNYSDCVRYAFQTVEPVFTRERYAGFFFHCASTVPGWLADVVMANAEAESHGSEKLSWLWRGSAGNSTIAADVLVHARDEARHARLFVSLVQQAFPGRYADAVLSAKRQALFHMNYEEAAGSRFFLPEQQLIDHLVQMNMGEIRTRTHMLLLAPVIFTLAPLDAKEKVRAILEGLVTDEVRHISYTAQFIEAWCASGDAKRIRDLYARRLIEFHRITIEQTEMAIRSYGAGRFPDLLEV